LFVFKTEGYTEIEIRDYEQLSGFESVDFTQVRARKINKTTRALTGTFFVKELVVDNKIIVEHLFFKKQGGEYRKLPYTLPPKPFCDYVNEDVYFYPEIQKVSNIPKPFPCPLPVVCLDQ
jgi:hypothetical protein